MIQKEQRSSKLVVWKADDKGLNALTFPWRNTNHSKIINIIQLESVDPLFKCLFIC